MRRETSTDYEALLVYAEERASVHGLFFSGGYDTRYEGVAITFISTLSLSYCRSAVVRTADDIDALAGLLLAEEAEARLMPVTDLQVKGK